MENLQFFPTNRIVFNKLIKGIRLTDISNVLEPSAGNGDILDMLKEKDVHNHIEYDCIEIDTNRRAVLKDKGYRLIGDDFLTFEPTKSYSLIIMNPPFKNGAEHLHKAIKIQERFGGKILCVLNAETFKNQYSTKRKVLYNTIVNKYHGTIEYMQDAFTSVDTQVKTDVEIAIVKVDIPSEIEHEKINYSKFKKETFDHNIDNDKNELISNSESIEDKISRYNEDVANVVEFFKAYEKIATLDIVDVTYSYKNSNVNLNDVIENLNKKYWQELFATDTFTKRLTNDQYYKWQNEIKNLKCYNFSIENIMEVSKKVFEQAITGLEDMAIKLFDRFTNEYYCDGCNNIHYYNGWKMNKAYIVGDKVKTRLHFYNEYGYFKGEKDYSFDTKRFLNDMEKVLDLFNNNDVIWNGESADTIINNEFYLNSEYTNKNLIETKYFKIKIYKKNTCDFIFKPECKEILKRLNIFGSKKKGWLPQTFGTKSYNDMSNEEKDVVNNFYTSDVYKSKNVENEYQNDISKNSNGINLIELKL